MRRALPPALELQPAEWGVNDQGLLHWAGIDSEDDTCRHDQKVDSPVRGGDQNHRGQ